MTLPTDSGPSQPKLPQDASKVEYLSAVRRSEPWLAATMAVCRLEGLTPRGELKHLSVDSSFAVIAVPPDHVVKFYGHWRSGRARHAAEVAALRRLGRDASLPVPRLVAAGELGEEWRYIVMSSLPGIRLADVEAQLGDAELRRIASWMGDFSRRVHAIPLTPEEIHDGLTRFRASMKDRLASLGERPALSNALPRHLHEQIEGWMPSAEELLGPPDRAVLVHGALRPHHVLGQHQDGRFLPTGVIDLNSALIGDPLYDLGYTWWCAFRGDRTLLDAYLAEADIAGVRDPDFPRRALAWALLNACVNAPRLPHLEDVRSLDELADRAFGPPALGGAPRAGRRL